MRTLIILLFTVLISGCIKSVITQADKDLLLTADDLLNLGCKKASQDDLEFETNGLKHLSKAIHVTYDGHNKCGFYLDVELTEVMISSMSKTLARQNAGAALLGIKLVDVKTRKPEHNHDGLVGSYTELYNEDGRYFGIVYTSEKNSKYILAMIFHKEKKQQPVFLDLLKLIEIRNMEKDKAIPKHKRYFIDSYVSKTREAVDQPS